MAVGPPTRGSTRLQSSAGNDGAARPSTTNPSSARFQTVLSAKWSSACLHGLKPGGHLAAFAAPSTAHRLACGLEEAGFELRDVLMWLQGQGYPATRVLPSGWGTGLKPAYEPILLARKPLARHPDPEPRSAPHRCPEHRRLPRRRLTRRMSRAKAARMRRHGSPRAEQGRWPANLAALPRPAHAPSRRANADCPIELLGERQRFFYAAKAPRRERDAGCEQLPRADRPDVQDRRARTSSGRGAPRREHPPDRQADRADALARAAPHPDRRARARPVHRQRQHRRRRRARGRPLPRDRARSGLRADRPSPDQALGCQRRPRRPRNTSASKASARR